MSLYRFLSPVLFLTRIIWWYIFIFFGSPPARPGVDVGDGFGPRILAQALEQLDKNEREHLGVVAGAVVVKIAEL